MKNNKKYFIVESRHNKDECLRALQETMKNGTEIFEKFNWGCVTGDHIGWARIEAQNADEAKKITPEFIREKVKVKRLLEFKDSKESFCAKSKAKRPSARYFYDDELGFI